MNNIQDSVDKGNITAIDFALEYLKGSQDKKVMAKGKRKREVLSIITLFPKDYL